MKRGSGPPPDQLLGTLRRLGISPKKSLGQHFLVDQKVLEQLVLAAQLTPEDVVLEVGPGVGTLTQELARKAKQVIAIEKDDRLAFFLKRELASSPNISVINADVLQTDLVALLTSAGFSSGRYKVVADLPYYITSAFLRYLLEAPLKPSLMVVMVQREVGEAIVAHPGQMSLLAVSVQFYGAPVIIDYISPRSFYPEPKVASAILKIDLYERPVVEVADVAAFFQVVRAGFRSRRKQLRNALAQGLDLPHPEVVGLLDRAGIASQRRAESLSLLEWASVCEAALALGVVEARC